MYYVNMMLEQQMDICMCACMHKNTILCMYVCIQVLYVCKHFCITKLTTLYTAYPASNAPTSLMNGSLLLFNISYAVTADHRT